MGGSWQLVFACCLLVQGLSAEDSAKANSNYAAKANSTSAVNSDEELEKKIGQQIASMQKMKPDEISSFADLALQYYNTKEVSVFMSMQDANVTVKKAIGSMLYLRMTLEKTNCTKKDVKEKRYFRILDSEKEEPTKYCGPLAGQDKEQLDCKFDIFKNERSYGEAVVSHDCKPVKVIDRETLNGEEMQS